MEFFGLSVLMMVPAGSIIVLLIVVYVIYNRVREMKKETFEKREN